MNVFEDRAFFHEGMRDWQDRFDGRRTAEAIEKNRKHYAFWEDEIAFIQAAPFFFIASTFEDYVDCNIKSGDPGFIKIVGPNILEYPEYDGNSMYRTVGNIAKNPNVGLLFVAFDGKSRRIRVNGKAEILTDPEALERHYGAKMVVRIECEIYPNCPRYTPNLADREPSPHVPREGEGTPPPPEWKTRDYIRRILPEGDPHTSLVNKDGREK
ncbi:pyridoxamine 5'-phosphate oxidase family protein [Nisaea sediminum]|uniref:pyridoxamine 5'-phosphate oxidase family protein n=1 Tax=Nisaea sediminum TaxID=2775867 RepID=UPI0018660507|nr:pyridoxamine 5'-phosphate oxidase family protein [Nisaea sediminum]